MMITKLDEKHVTLESAGGLTMVMDCADLRRNARHPQAFDAILREAYKIGSPIHITYMLDGKLKAEEISHALYHGRSMRMGM